MCELHPEMPLPHGAPLRHKAGDGRTIYYEGWGKPGQFRCSWDEGGKRKERWFRVEDLECASMEEPLDP